MRYPFSYLILLSLIIAACEKMSPDIIAQETPDLVPVVETIQENYSLVYGADSTNARGLSGFLDSFSLVEFTSSSDENTEIGRFVIGSSDIEITAAELEQIDGVGFVVRRELNDLIIAGSNETWTALALYELVDYLSSNGFAVRDSLLTIPEVLLLKEEYSDPQLIARLLQGGYEFSLTSEFLLTCPGLGNCTIGQGATSDGTKIFVLNKNNSDNQSILFRFDLQSLKWEGQSGIFNAGHSNDLAYNPDKDLIVIAHGMEQGQILTLAQASNLSVISDVGIDVGASSVSYNSKKKQYAFSQGGATLHFTDDSFNVISSYSRENMVGYTAQGMGADDQYVYFPMSSSKDNIIVVYDWDGQYIKTLTLPVKMESESLFYSSGEYYVNYNRRGSEVHRIHPVMYYTFNNETEL